MSPCMKKETVGIDTLPLKHLGMVKRKSKKLLEYQ